MLYSMYNNKHVMYMYMCYCVLLFVWCVGIVQLSPNNTLPIHFGQDVMFICEASTTTFVSISVDDYGTETFERNSNKTVRQLGPVVLNLTRADIDPASQFLTIFEVKGILEDARDSLNITCSDVSGSMPLFILLKSKSYSYVLYY